MPKRSESFVGLFTSSPCGEKPRVSQGCEAANQERFPPVSQHVPSACLLIAGLSLWDPDCVESDGRFLTT